MTGLGPADDQPITQRTAVMADRQRAEVQAKATRKPPAGLEASQPIFADRRIELIAVRAGPEHLELMIAAGQLLEAGPRLFDEAHAGERIKEATAEADKDPLRGSPRPFRILPAF